MTDRSVIREDRKLTSADRAWVRDFNASHGDPVNRADRYVQPVQVTPRVNRWDDIANRAMGA